MANKSGINGQKVRYDPTPEQIKEECAKIRAERVNLLMIASNHRPKVYEPIVYKQPRVR